MSSNDLKNLEIFYVCFIPTVLKGVENAQALLRREIKLSLKKGE